MQRNKIWLMSELIRNMPTVKGKRGEGGVAGAGGMLSFTYYSKNL